MIFDGATRRPNSELKTKTGKPSDQILKSGDTPTKPLGRQPEEKNMCSGSIYQGKETIKHLKPGQTDPSGLLARSKEETDKESKEEEKLNVGTGVVRTLQG